MGIPLKRLIWQWRGVLIAAPGITLLVTLIRLAGGLQLLEWAAYDQFLRWRPADSPDSRIVIVGIQESDLQTYGFPIPDRVLARLLNKVKQQHPRAIGLDLYRNLPVEPGHAELVTVFESTPNLVGIRKIGGQDATGAIPPAPVLQQHEQIAANDVIVDGDGKLRRGLLSLTDPREKNPDRAEVIGLAFAVSMLYLQAYGIQPELTPEQVITLGAMQLPALEANDGGYVGADASGYQILLNYQRPPGSFTTVSLQQVLTDAIAPDLLRDRIVLIGTTAESIKDFFYTPYSAGGLQLLRPTPGVEIHAQLASQLLSAAQGQRSVIRFWPEWAEWSWMTAWAMMGSWLIWQQRFRAQTRAAIAPTSPVAAAGLRTRQPLLSPTAVHFFQVLCSLLLASGALVLISYGALLAHWWIPVIAPWLAFTGSAIATTGYQAQTAALMRKTLGRYLTDEVVSSLLETPEGLTLIGEKRTVTTLISDIRGFTSLSEQLPPEQVVKLLNEYLRVMIQVIRRYGGTINDVTGDGLVIFFGAPLQRPDDSHRAVACAIAMQLAMETVNQQSQQWNLPQLSMGIGINTGEVVVGNIGSEHLTKYTAIGSHVNVAARIEAFTVGGQVLISQSTFESMADIVRVAGQTQAYMKGVTAPVTLYEVSGIGGIYQIFLPDDQSAEIPLRYPIPLVYRPLDGKHLSQECFPGELIELSAQGAQITASHRPQPLTNLQITLVISPDLQDLLHLSGEQLDSPDSPMHLDIYAKVIARPEQQTATFPVRFTSVPATVETVLQHLRGDRRARQA